MKNAGKATAAEFQLPACSAFLVMLLWSGTWLTSTRGKKLLITV